MKFKVGDKVILKDPNSSYSTSDTMGDKFKRSYNGKTIFTVTSIYDDFVRIEGEDTGWFSHTFELYTRDNILPEDLFKL